MWDRFARAAFVGRLVAEGGRARALPRLIALLLFLLLGALAPSCPTSSGSGTSSPSAIPGPELDEVRDYALRCYERLEITEADMNAFAPLDCDDGEQLWREVNGTKVDLNSAAAGGTPSATMPATCDTPAWLLLGSSKQCYGHTYLRRMKFPANKNVTGAFLCRHKKFWQQGNTNFSDIAMILHNKRNGETCWFQSNDGKDNLEGTNVPLPHTPAKCTLGPNKGMLCANDAFCDSAPGAGDGKCGLWLLPSITARVQCVKCHDSGPFMNSRWVRDQGPSLRDGLGPYHNNGKPFAADWKDPQFVTIALKGRAPDLVHGTGPCTSCHKIHIAEKTPGGSTYQTCDKWIKFSVGDDMPYGYPKHSNAAGQGFDIAYWMPESHGEANAADWKKEYGDSVKKLLTCCGAKGIGVKECGLYAPKVRAAALPGALPGARILASVDGGATFPYENRSNAPPPGAAGPHLLPPGSQLTVAWEADADHDLCMIEATFPAGVEVPGVETPIVATATNWGLDDSPQTLGSLSAPGFYRFDVYCDEDDADPISTQLIFELAGLPATYLTIQALVSGTPGDVATNTPGPDTAFTAATLTDTVQVAWTADEVVDGTCLVTETHAPGGATGLTYDDAYGLEAIVSHAATDQTYELGCTGNDGLFHTVSVTVQFPPLGTYCDVDFDGDVDNNDVAAVAAAIGTTPTGPDDPRDANGDGLISFDDGRECVLVCTNTACAP